MKITGRFVPLCAIWLLSTALPASADVPSLAASWDDAMYRTEAKSREAALGAPTDRARREAAANPGDAALLTWYGIITSSYAGEKGGLGALSLAKEARGALEQAIARDPTVMRGSPYTSLGTLYHKVPGWPIGFGSDKKARELLSQALAIGPNDIDANYFMADFLCDEGEYASARTYLVAALSAPDRPGRDVGDEGRRAEVRALLAKVDDKLRK